ncbi:MAG: hypothetical protein ACLUOI_20215 [Eisenbergiella sp.]
MNLTGCSLDSMNDQISSGYPVIARISSEATAVIVGYDIYNIWIYYPETQEVSPMASDDATALLESLGNIFVSYRENGTAAGNDVKRKCSKLAICFRVAGISRGVKEEMDMDERIQKLAHNLVSYSCRVSRETKSGFIILAGRQRSLQKRWFVRYMRREAFLFPAARIRSFRGKCFCTPQRNR